MNKILSLLLSIFILISCKNDKPSTIEKVEKLEKVTKLKIQTEEKKDNQIIVDKVHIGMTIQEMKDKYPNAEFIKEPVYEYGIDGESFGIVVKENGNPRFFVWTMLNDTRIKGITILSKDIMIDGIIHVGMTLERFLKKYPNKTLAIDLIDERIEFSDIPELKYRVEFITTDSTRIAEYDFEVGEPEFIKVKNLKKEIDRISIN